MSIEGLAALIVAIAALAGTGITLYKTRNENRSASGDTAGTYQEIASKSAKRELELMNRADELNKRLDDIEKKLDMAQRRIVILEDHVLRLTAQVVSLGGVPVQEDVTKPKGEGK